MCNNLHTGKLVLLHKDQKVRCCRLQPKILFSFRVEMMLMDEAGKWKVRIDNQKIFEKFRTMYLCISFTINCNLYRKLHWWSVVWRVFFCYSSMYEYQKTVSLYRPDVATARFTLQWMCRVREDQCSSSMYEYCITGSHPVTGRRGRVHVSASAQTADSLWLIVTESSWQRSPAQLEDGK